MKAGDGIELGRVVLNAGAAAFKGQALVVLTDGLENQSKSLADVSGSIDARTFAIGLGTAQQVSTAALSTIAHNTGGYILLTGPLTPDTDSYFLLSKYFQQILVSATNENIVTDPSGFIGSGQRVRIPFTLAETEIDATAVLLTDLPAVRLSLETPAGNLLTEANLASLGAQVVHGTNMTFVRMALPLPVGAGAHGGTWHAVLNLDDRRFKRELARLAAVVEQRKTQAVELERARSHGARYCVTVSAWSNLRMDARMSQRGFEPGATCQLDVTLQEFGRPVERARVLADVLRPDGVMSTRMLRMGSPGAFEDAFVAVQPGVWRVRVKATGATRSGRAFAREQLLTAAVIVGGDRPVPPPAQATKNDTLSCLLRCLGDDPGWERWLREHGIDRDRLHECVERCRASAPDARELDQLG